MLRSKFKLARKFLIISFFLFLEWGAMINRPVERCYLGFVKCVQIVNPNPAAPY